MTLSEFCELIRTNIDSFEDEYVDKRASHPNPDDAYPLTLTPEMWFGQLDIWFRILEIKKGSNQHSDFFEENSEAVEFKIDDFEEE